MEQLFQSGFDTHKFRMMCIRRNRTKNHEHPSVYPFVEQIRFLQSSSAMYRGRCTIPSFTIRSF